MYLYQHGAQRDFIQGLINLAQAATIYILGFGFGFDIACSLVFSTLVWFRKHMDRHVSYKGMVAVYKVLCCPRLVCIDLYVFGEGFGLRLDEINYWKVNVK